MARGCRRSASPHALTMKSLSDGTGSGGSGSALSCAAQRQQRVDVGLGLDLELGDRRLGLRHPPRDQPLGAGQLLGAGRGRAGPAAGAGRGGRARAATVVSDARLGGHVGAGDPAARARALQLLEVDAVARRPSGGPAGSPARRRNREPFPFSFACGGRPRRRGRRVGGEWRARGAGRRAAGVAGGGGSAPSWAIGGADRQRLPDGGDDRQRALRRGLVGHRRLVGLDLDQLLADGDRVAVLLEPAEDRALLHRVRQARHRDLGHGIRSRAAPTIVSASMPK